jgi:hypothetical protein
LLLDLNKLLKYKFYNFKDKVSESIFPKKNLNFKRYYSKKVIGYEKNSTMVTLILALVVAADYWFGFFFIPRKIEQPEEISAITDSKLDIANQKSGDIENQIVESLEKFDTIETTLTKLQPNRNEEVIDQNIPIRNY